MATAPPVSPPASSPASSTEARPDADPGGGSDDGSGAPFSAGFQAELERLMCWRRDVRHFRPDPVPEALLAEALASFALAPSVGLSEPWRLVRLGTTAARRAIQQNFEAANAEALAGYAGERAALYARLKLAGLDAAPVQLSVFCDEATTQGHGLGAATMPEARAYSVVAGIQNFWLAARARGLGVGWVSILDPGALSEALALPTAWRFVGHLCIGWPAAESETPELERAGWERRSGSPQILER
ncbi:MAG: 5,6-dimethylbenzimidazole synthase [Pseudomonadota bacterium]